MRARDCGTRSAEPGRGGVRFQARDAAAGGGIEPAPGDPDFDYRSRASSEFTVSNGPYEPGLWIARKKPTRGWWNRSLSGVGRCHRPVRRSRFGIDWRARSPRGKVSFFFGGIVTIAFEVFARCEPGSSAACAAHEARCPVGSDVPPPVIVPCERRKPGARSERFEDLSGVRMLVWSTRPRVSSGVSSSASLMTACSTAGSRPTRG